VILLRCVIATCSGSISPLAPNPFASCLLPLLTRGSTDEEAVKATEDWRESYEVNWLRSDWIEEPLGCLSAGV
jgi:hypothetical protein